MTPAKVFALQQRRMDFLALSENPIASFHATFYNMNRDPGDKDKGRPAARAMAPSEFKVFRDAASLAAKVKKPKRNHRLHGAEANRDEWEAFAGQSKVVEIVSSTKPRKVR